MGRRLAAKLKDIKAQLRARLHGAIGDTVKWLQAVVRGISNTMRYRITRNK
jgi:hypothetical protein